MKFYILLMVAAVAAKQCESSRETKDTSARQDALPECIQQMIDARKAQPKTNPPAQVDAYTYKGKTVYVFSSPCCDQYNVAYDSNCKEVCAPSGGLTGKGDRKCTDFADSATFIKNVFKDER